MRGGGAHRSSLPRACRPLPERAHMAHGAQGRREIRHHPTSSCACTSTHVHVRVPGASSPDLRDVTRLTRVRPPRATEFTTQQRTWAGWWQEREIQHTCDMWWPK